MTIMRSSPGVQLSLKGVCGLKTLVGISLQTEEIP